MTNHTNLPTASYVDTRESLAAAIAAIGRAPVAGFDTEFVGESTYEPQLCLLQVSTTEGIWVIDPLSGIDLRAFWAALTEPGREVVALAARQELLFCLRDAGRTPTAVFDPQLVAGLVGYGYPLSHTNLVLRVLDVRVPSGETFTDWRKRPLTPTQLEYAAADVQYLLTIRARLLDRAQALGRAGWIQDESAHLVERVVHSEQEERWWRVSGAMSLNRRGLAVLRELWRWRDQAARTADLPVRRIMGDDMMVEIAKRSPKTVPDLFALRGLDRMRKAGPELVAAVQAGLRLPEKDLPQLKRRDDPPQVAILGHLASVVAGGLAAQHQVDQALLATTADLQDLVRWHLGLGDEGRPAILDGWRGAILGQPLLDLLAGKSALRVADAQSPNPLRLEER